MNQGFHREEVAVAVDIKSYTAKMYCLAISLPDIYFRVALKSIRSAHTRCLFFSLYNPSGEDHVSQAS